MTDSKNQNIYSRPIVFSLSLAAVLSLFMVSLSLLLTYLSDIEINPIFVFSWMVLFFVGAFFIIRRKVEKYIHSKIAQIYNSVSILDIKDLNKKNINTDVELLKREVIKFAETNRLEIENLKAQEVFRREFIGNLAHELKTPLFTVQGYIETLEEGAHEDPVIRVKYLERARKGVERLIDIAKDLDLITKLETGDQGLEISNFEIKKLCDELVELIEIRASKKNITLNVDCRVPNSLMVSADREKISAVLTNLISNSIKYGKENGSTNIIIIDNGQNVSISVKDNGEGMKKIHLKRIFERFYRIDRHRSREVGGSGLGLSIVKHVLEAHGQKIYVESELTFGSTFSFNLPKAN